MKVTGSAYPWDVIGDDAFVREIRDGGVREVALAAAYHSVRAATPRHPRTAFVDAEHAAFYLPRRPSAWESVRVQPVAPGGWSDGDAFLRAADEARTASIDVSAWVVLTHSRVIGARHPELVVRSAFGNRHLHALCPSHADVREYAVTLVAETVLQSGVDRIVLEACGPLGFDHAGAHEKTAGADWSELDRTLLSLCFCDGCRAGYVSRGVDCEAAMRAVRAAVGAGLEGIDEALGDELAAVLLDVRAEARTRLSAAVTESARHAGASSVVSHGSLRAEATGPFAAVRDDGVERDLVLLSGGEARSAGSVGIADAHRTLGTAIGVAENVADGSSESIAGAIAADRALPIDEISVGHLGLLSRERFGRVVAALT